MNLLKGKKVKLRLEGLNGNVFNLLAQFIGAARKQGFTEDEIDKVLISSRDSDYDHALGVLIEHTEAPSDV